MENFYSTDSFSDILLKPLNYKTQLDDYWDKVWLREYYTLLSKVKSEGYKVYRNPEGKHKVLYPTT